MRLAWMTDIHLNFLEPADRRRFLESARDQADGFVISGDIAESPSITGVLTEMGETPEHVTDAYPLSRWWFCCDHGWALNCFPERDA